MPGYLNYIVTPVVTEEPLTENQKRRLAKEVQNTTVAVVLDDDITVVEAEQQQVALPMVHIHRSTPRRNCDWCAQLLAGDEQSVVQPEEV